MPEILVEASSGSYPVHIEAGVLGRVGGFVRTLAGSSAVLVVCDHNTAEIAGNRVARDAAAEILEVEPGEGTKTFPQLESVCNSAAGHGLDRGSVIVAVGGGVVGDLAGTVAALYLRGIRLVQVPTTLLAMVDSSIGGKVAVNLPAGKNLVGAFKPPEEVFVDPAVLASLPDREFRSGMAEVVKSGCIADPGLTSMLLALGDEVRARRPAELEEMITRTCRVKAGVVSRDERESGERAILNYGHTVAHALEAASAYSPDLCHGDAVSVGMEVAGQVGLAAGITPAAVVELQRQLLTAFGLPLRSPVPVALKQVLAATARDKKSIAGEVRWVLLEAIGQATWGHRVEAVLVRAAVRNIL